MKQEVNCTIRHIDDFFDAGTKLIVTVEEVSLAGEVLFDCLLHARVQELRVPCGVKVAVVVCGVIQHFDVAVDSRLPLPEAACPNRGCSPIPNLSSRTRD
jgi:hypothetical protein